MPRSSWLSSHTSSSHLPSLLTPSMERTPSFSSGTSTPAGLASGANTPAGGHRPSPLNVPIPQTPAGSQGSWGNDDSNGTPYSSSTPSSSSAYFPFTPSTAGFEPTSFHTPAGHHGHHGHSTVEIHLDQDHVVLRGAGGDTNPARLGGTVVLQLVESTNLKDVVLTLTGKAKVQFGDGAGGGSRSHHHSHPIINHEWNFLSNNGSGKKSSQQTHTLKAGIHSFPFSMTIESDTTFPSSLRTWNNEAHVSYKLRAVAIRSGAFSSNFQATKSVSLLRTYTSEALEFTQTLEIENSWPMKVAYSLTLPHKAFAAGDNIPIVVKFQPLMKGVHVTSISTVVKEYTLVHTKNSSHPDVRVAASIRHDIRNGKAYVHREKHAPNYIRPPNAPREEDSPVSTPVTNNTPLARSATGPRTAPIPSGSAGAGPDGYFPQVHSLAGAGRTSSADQNDIPRTSISSETESGANQTINFIGGLDPATASHSDSQAMYLQAREENREVELGDSEVDTMISIPLPTWTTPSHSIHPVFVSHKIKWSCVISNPDGHTSELRCALPIVVLPPSLAEEARIASAHTRSVLFGCRTDMENENVIDLPSYGNHVYDRVANANVASSSGTTAAAWSRRSPANTPPSSRPGSRPGSPQFGMRPLVSSLPTNGQDPQNDPDGIPERPNISWADSELLLSLGALGNPNGQEIYHSSQPGSPHQTPPETRSSSRTGFRLPRTRSGSSRPASRASSPERGFGMMTPLQQPESLASQPSASSGGLDGTGAGGGSSASASGSFTNGPPPIERRGSHGHSLFNIPSKAMKPFTQFGHHKHKPTSSGLNSGEQTPLQSPNMSSTSLSAHFAPLNSSPTGGGGGGGGGSTRPSPGPSPAGSQAPTRQSSYTDVSALSQVPSYSVASRGFLGGGVVPLSAVQGLPDYDESENLQRTQSEGNLMDISRRAVAANGLTPVVPKPSRLRDGSSTPDDGQSIRQTTDGSIPVAAAAPPLPTASAGLTTSASSSALASSLSTAAPGGTRAVPKPMGFTPVPAVGPRSTAMGDDDEDDEEEDDDHLLIRVGGKKNSRSPSISTVVPQRP